MANQGRINFTVGFNIDQAGLNQLKSSLASLQNLKTSDLVGVDSKKAKAELDQIKASAKQVEAALQQSFNPALNTHNIDTFKQKILESGYTIDGLRTKWAEVGAKGTVAFRQLTTAISSTKLPLQETHNLLKSMGTTFLNTIKWSIASQSLNTMTGSVQKAWSYTQKLDESLNNIMLVTDKSSDSMEKFARQANKAAKELGKSTTDYTNASLIYYQQGLNDAEVKARTETTLKAANVTKQSTDAVSEQLTAVWNGYKVQAEETELYVDKLSAVAASTAADLEELSTGMSKVASAANVMGVDIDQLNGMLATIVSVTREAPESIGTALKTVFARMSDIEAGLDTETTLGEYTSQMAEMGINALDANGHLRDMGDVVEEIGNKWESMTREQQVSLAQTIAGTRQYSRMMALFDNWEMYESSMKTSAEATGFLQQQQDEYMESIEAHLEKLSTSGERVYDALFDPDSVNSLLDALTAGVDLFANFVESIGGGGNLLMALVPVMTRLFSGSIASGVATFVTNMGNAKNTTASLKGLLENIQSIKIGDGFSSDYDKKIKQLRTELVRLRQEGVLTNEEFNSLTDEINAFADAVSEYELKAEQLSPQKISSKILDLEKTGFGGPVAGSRASYTEKTLEGYLSRLGGGLDISKIQKGATKIGDASAEAGYQRVSQGLQQIIADANSVIDSGDALAKSFDGISKNAEGAYSYTKKFANSIKTALPQGQRILKSGLLQGDDVSQLKAALDTMSALGKETSLNEEQYNELIIAVTNFKRISGQTMDPLIREAKNAQAAVDELATVGLDGVLNKVRMYEGAVERSIKKSNLEKQVQSWINIASQVGMIASALSMIGQLPSIWNNDDLSFGQKMLQTVTNISSIVGMMAPTILAIVKWSKALNIEEAKRGALILWNNSQKAIEDEITEKIVNKEKRKLILQELQNGNLSDQNALLLQQLGITKKLTLQEKLREGWSKTKTGFKDFGSGFGKGFTGKGKDAFKVGAGASKAAGAGQIVGAIAPYALAVAVIAGSALAAYKIVENINQKEKKAYEDAQTRSKIALQHAEELNSEYQELETSLSDLASSTDAFGDLTKGTVEWQKALSDVNAQVLELLGKYPELYQYVETDEDGLMTITAAGQTKLKEQQLAELENARAGSIAAQINARKANIEYRKDELAEASTSAIRDSEEAAAWMTGGAAALGAIVGTIIFPGIGTLIGAGIGAIDGAVRSAVGFAIQENQEEDFKATLDEDKLANAFATGGKAIFESEAALAKALGKTTDELSANERALLANKDEAVALGQALADNTATIRASLIEQGRSLMGEDATTGAQIIAAEKYNEEYNRILNNYLGNQGGNSQDKAEVLRLLNYMGLSEANFIGTKGTNRVQYLDKEGNEQDKSMQEIYQLLAQYDIKNASDDIVAAIKEEEATFNNAFSEFDAATRDILSQIGSENFSFGSATKAQFDALKNLGDQEFQALAKFSGRSVEEIEKSYLDARKVAAAGWASPGNLKGTALSYFNSMEISLDSLTQSTYTQFANYFGEIYDRFGKEALDNLYTILDGAGEASDELITELMSTVDWSSDDAYGQVNTILNDLELHDLDPERITDYVQQMLQLNDIYSLSKEKIQEIAGSIEDILDGIEFGDVIDKDKMGELIKDMPGIEKYFTELANGDWQLTSGVASIEEAKQRVTRENARSRIEGINQQVKNLEDAQDLVGSDGFRKTKEALNIAKDKADAAQKEADNVFYDEWLRQSLFKNSSLTVNEIKEKFSKLKPKDQEAYRARGLRSNEAYAIAENAASQAEEDYYEAKAAYDALVDDVKALGAKNTTASDISTQIAEAKKQYKDAFIQALSSATSVEELQELVEEYSKLTKDSIRNEALEYLTVLSSEAFEGLNYQSVLSKRGLQEYLEASADSEKNIFDAAQKALAELQLGTADFDKQIERLTNRFEVLERELDSLAGTDAYKKMGEQIELAAEKLKLLEDRKSAVDEIDENALKAEANAFYKDLEKAGYTINGINSGEALFNNAITADGKVNASYYSALLELQAGLSQNDPAAGVIKSFLAALDKYEENALEKEETIAEARLEAQEAYFQAYEKWAEGIEIGERQAIDLREFERGLLDEDDFSRMFGLALADATAVDGIFLANAEKRFDELDKELEAGKINRAQWIEGYESAIDTLQSDYELLYESINAMEEARVGAVEAISEAYEKQVGYLEEINSLLEHQKKVTELLYGEEAYGELNRYFEAALSNSAAISQAAQARLASATERYNNIDTLAVSDEEREAIIEEYLEAGKAAADAMYSEMEARREKYLNDTEIALQKFQKSIYGENTDISLLTDQWAWAQESVDGYYDSVQRLYALEDLESTFTSAINSTDNSRVQARIAALMEEQLGYAESLDKLSEYDVKRAEQKLSILQAEIALEEARENKNQMRLARGADGSYSYQYVADQEQIAKLQDELNSANSELYDMDLEEYTSSVDKFNDAVQDLTETIRTLGEDGFTEEELEFIDRKRKQVEEIAAESSRINELYLGTMADAADIFGKSLSELSSGTIKSLSIDVDEIINKVATTGLEQSYTTLMGNLKVISEKYLGEQESAAASLDKVLNGEDGKSGLINSYETLAEKQGTVIGQYKDEYDKLTLLLPKLNSLKTKYDEIGTSINNLATYYKKLAEAKGLVGEDPPSEGGKGTGENGDNVNLGLKGIPGADGMTFKEKPIWMTEDNWKHYLAWHGKETESTALSPSEDPYSIGGNLKKTEGRWQWNSTGDVEVNDINCVRNDSGEFTGEQKHYEAQFKLGEDTFPDKGGYIYVDRDGEKWVKAQSKGKDGAYYYLRAKSIITDVTNKQVFPNSFDTGGYTGSWGDSSGRMAMLHEKEIVLNKDDTINFLKAIETTRSIADALNNSTFQSMAQMLAYIPSMSLMLGSETQLGEVKQSVHIEANFPNVSVKKEIEEAFEDIINLAAQYASES